MVVSSYGNSVVELFPYNRKELQWPMCISDRSLFAVKTTVFNSF